MYAKLWLEDLDIDGRIYKISFELHIKYYIGLI
jgi:hypothetical protein